MSTPMDIDKKRANDSSTSSSKQRIHFGSLEEVERQTRKKATEVLHPLSVKRLV